jgi:glycosyltransferase involved in cell wall biosynthesis
LIRALRDIDARLTLIGDGPLRGSLEVLAEQLGVRDRIAFVSAVPHAEIAAYYGRADVFAMATHYEGFCIPVLEAMAAGLPVVASRIGPIEEIVGDAGLLVENTPEAFAEALSCLAADPVLRAALGQQARARASDIDGTMMEAQERQVYEEALGQVPEQAMQV